MGWADVLYSHECMSPCSGVSPFDLLGAYGQLGWLSNLSLVLTYNTAFAAATTLCLVTKFTASVRAEIFKR